LERKKGVRGRCQGKELKVSTRGKKEQGQNYRDTEQALGELAGERDKKEKRKVSGREKKKPDGSLARKKKVFTSDW